MTKYLYDKVTYIQAHKAECHFEYELAVDWAIRLIDQGIETTNVLMLASFGKPIDSDEIRPYVSAVLKDLGLEEFNGRKALLAKAHFHTSEIIAGNALRFHLYELYRLRNDYDLGLINFLLLYFAWDELEELGSNYYYPDADISNIEQILKKESMAWIDNYLSGEFDTEKIKESRIGKTQLSHPRYGKKSKPTFINKIWFWLYSK